jgi:putative hydrolase of the HAD superfamily
MINFILFDLDNTLYPKSSGLDKEIDRLMTEFTGAWLRISRAEALELRKTEAIPYGTTLKWLNQKHGFRDQDKFLEAVHPKNVEAWISPDPELRSMLDAIDLPKAVLTNSPMEHAVRVLERLGIKNHFTKIFDIRYNRFTGKPNPEAYQRALRDTGQDDIRRVLFVEDLPRYLIPFRDMGGQAVLVDEQNLHGDTGLPSIRKITELKYYIGNLLQG